MAMKRKVWFLKHVQEKKARGSGSAPLSSRMCHAVRGDCAHAMLQHWNDVLTRSWLSACSVSSKAKITRGFYMRNVVILFADKLNLIHTRSL